MRLSDFTTVELQRVARALLRSYLDVRTGAAPAAALARFLSPVAAIGLQRLMTDHRGSPSARHGDLGQVTVLRLSPDRAYAIAALARPGEGAREVLSVELKVQGERVAAVRVGEAESRARERQDLREIQLVGPGQPVPEPPAHLVGLLGGVPSDPMHSNAGRVPPRSSTPTGALRHRRRRLSVRIHPQRSGATPGTRACAGLRRPARERGRGHRAQARTRGGSGPTSRPRVRTVGSPGSSRPSSTASATPRCSSRSAGHG